MIVNDTELAILRERLQQVERILELTKQECGRNPVQYYLFSANIIDMIDEMRADIDAYLGTTLREGAAPAAELEPTGGRV